LGQRETRQRFDSHQIPYPPDRRGVNSGSC
jgi:hypothetical protein